MTQEYQLRILPEVAANEQELKAYLVREKGLNERDITALRILKRSIDARQRTVFVNLTVRAYVNEMPKEEEYAHTPYRNVEGHPQAIVVGAGPGGLFAALRLIELGVRPIVVERGKNVRERKKDIALISREQAVNPESNYSFGEGGAGAYSDGKLYTRSKKRGNVEKILNVFCQHGASTSILVDAHPHIGTDKLPRVIENMRNTILECGGEVHFETRMDALIIEGDDVKGIETNTGQTFLGPVILATGHSARDVYRWLAAHNVEIEPKGIAVGVRLEHPATLIDQIQYHNRNGRGAYLPAAEYSFVTQVDGRGVYSFCMCPGGFVVPAASGPEQIVVNGMSPSNRGSRWSNSGMVVELRPEDLLNEELRMKNEEWAAQCEQAARNTPNGNSSFQKDSSFFAHHSSSLKVLFFQEYLEHLCWQQGNRKQTAPAQRMVDFTRKKLSYDLPDSSYAPGLLSSPLHFWMPRFIADRLSKGFQQFGKYSHGFLTNEAVMIGVETRTSAPVRIVRDKDTLQHVRIRGLFPCGEGAGYAGGIVSAGIDGERCAEAAKAFLDSTRNPS
ncbi:MAG: FAD-binding protein [Bacteroides sp.]|nr:FAD-binding protein [Bacteroides sp.]